VREGFGAVDAELFIHKVQIELGNGL
jgi:hypothetical protein